MSARRGVRRAIGGAAALVLLSGAAVAMTTSSAYAQIADKRNDFTGDGISDIVAVDWWDGGCLHRWAGDGSGGFGAGVQVSGCGWGPYKSSLSAPGDLNRDGKGDIVSIASGGSSDCLYRWYGNGNGSFGRGAKVGCWLGLLQRDAGGCRRPQRRRQRRTWSRP